jgi:hypothetical protein
MKGGKTMKASITTKLPLLLLMAILMLDSSTAFANEANSWLTTIVNSDVKDFISTFGLSVLLVLYFVLYRDPRHWNRLNKRYKELYANYSDEYRNLSGSYETLKEVHEKLKRTFEELSTNVRPGIVKMDESQSKKLHDLAVDRDLYKLYFRICERLERSNRKGIRIFLQETINDTNETWDLFPPPFHNPEIRSIRDLYGMYINKGTDLRVKLNEILNSTASESEKKETAFNLLLNNATNMKTSFQENLSRHRQGENVEQYNEVLNENGTLKVPLGEVEIAEDSQQEETKSQHEASPNQ